MSDHRTDPTALAICGDSQWPTNEELGGSFTGTRDDEFRDQYRDDAKRALAAADSADAEQGIKRVNVDEAAERIRALLVLPNMTDRVNGDPMFILGWEAASEEILARLPEIVAALTDEPSDTNWGDRAGAVL